MTSARIVLKAVSSLTALAFFAVCWPGPHGGPQFLWEILAAGVAREDWLSVVLSLVAGGSLVGLMLFPFLASEKMVFRCAVAVTLCPTAMLVYIVTMVAKPAFVFTLSTAIPFFIGAASTAGLAWREKH
jgi:cytochrome c oxidase subunit IV